MMENPQININLRAISTNHSRRSQLDPYLSKLILNSIYKTSGKVNIDKTFYELKNYYIFTQNEKLVVILFSEFLSSRDTHKNTSD